MVSSNFAEAFDFTNGLSRIETLGAGVRAIHDGVTTIKFKTVV